MRTEFIVDYNLYDLTALQDAREESKDNASFADLSRIKNNVTAPVYGTLEHNFFLLDGSREEFPEDPEGLVFFSKGQSDETGVFREEQSIVVKFTDKHTSVGLTLTFQEAYPVELEIFWYDLEGRLISKRKFYPDALVYFCKHQVEDYGKIKIVFLKALPWHNVKLQYIKYGTSIIWDSNTIKAGKVVNDTDPISDKIATDTLTFDFVDKYNEFNPGNPEGMHKTFQRRQDMLAYEIVEGEKIPVGMFFLDSSSTSEHVCKMKAVDLKGMLDYTDFLDGRIYNGEKAGAVIAEIMDAAGIKNYTVDTETADTPLYGTLAVQTCKKALREVLFACGSIVSTSMQTGLSIRKSSKAIRSKIRRGRKFETTLETDRYVSDISVKYKTWTLEDTVSEITKGIYGEGIHLIQFSDPAINLTVNAGQILKQMPYYIILKMPMQGGTEVVISGQKYVSVEMAALSSVEKLKSGELRNTKIFSGTLLNFESAKKAADRILEYYQLQQIIKAKYIAGDEKAGNWAEIDNPEKSHGNFVAAIESITTDLTGGFISTAKCRGYYELLADYYIVGEIYTGEESGIL